MTRVRCYVDSRDGTTYYALNKLVLREQGVKQSDIKNWINEVGGHI